MSKVASAGRGVFTRLTATILLIVAVALSGCTGSTGLTASIEEYQTRLARVLDISIPSPDTSNTPLAFPSVSERTVDIPPMSINLRDFYAIQECELGRIVAERNTVLGKTQLPSQRFAYEQRLRTVLADCEAVIAENNQQLSALLAMWREQKRTQWPLVWAQLVQNSGEIKQGLSLANAPLQSDSTNAGSSSINALFYLDNLNLSASNQSEFESKELERQLQVIAKARLPAKMWLTQHVLSQRLTALTVALEQPLAEVSCTNGIASDKAKILRNVFYLFFIEEIQPVGSKLNHLHYQLSPLWQRWINTEVLTPAFKQFIAHHAVIGFENYQQAMSEHVTLWQRFLGRCNLAPVAS